MSSETAKTDDTHYALGNTGTEEPRQEDSKLNEVLVKAFYSIRFRCKYCEMSYPEMSGIRTHLQRHDEYKLYECTDCQASFCNVDDFLFHFNLHPEKEMKCSKCSRKFQKSLITFGKHLELHNCFKLYQCESCSYNNENHSNMKTHVQNHTTGNFKCDTCMKTFRYFSDLEEHLLRRCQDNYFKCISCDKKFEIFRKLDLHIRFSKRCQNKITHQSKQSELVRVTPSSVSCSSEPETYRPTKPYGKGTSSTCGQQISSSPQQANSCNVREVLNFPKRLRTYETRSRPGTDEVPDLHLLP